MARGIVRVGDFPNAVLAALAQGMLAENGIQSEVSGAMAQTWAGGDVGFFGVRLEVRAEDAERARSLLSDVEEGTRARLEAEEVGEDADPSEGAAAGEDHVTVPSMVATGRLLSPSEASASVPDTPGDALARRCRNAAVLSLVLSPLLIYAIVLFLRALEDEIEATLTSKGRRWRNQARVVIVALLALYTAVLIYLP